MRRSQVFNNVEIVDVELGFFRAHTGRFSSPSSGKGLNLHNCVSINTPILTSEGLKPVQHIMPSDLVWDGEEFVHTAGASYEGERECIRPLGGVSATEEQPIWTGSQMVANAELTPCQRVLAVAAGYRSLARAVRSNRSLLNVPGVVNLLHNQLINYARQPVVGPARTDEDVSTIHGDLAKAYLVSTDDVTTTCSTDTDNTGTSAINSLNISEIVLLQDGKISEHLFSIVWDYLAGMIDHCNLIVSTMTEDMPQETYASCLVYATTETERLLSVLKQASIFLNIANGTKLSTSKDIIYSDKAVFDIRGAGPLARYQAAGLLVANCPKHDKSIAKPVREMFRLPKELCFVRSDLANVEYRIEGQLTRCKTVQDMFDPLKGGNIFNDPYCQAWLSMTNQKITKKDPIRQVAKAAVLGLGFSMGPTGFARSLLTAVADKKSGVTEEVLLNMGAELGWPNPAKGITSKIITDLGCSYTVAKTAYYIHRKFNEAHPEFAATANWLVDCVNGVASSLGKEDAQYGLELQRDCYSAPDSSLVELSIDDEDIFTIPSVRVKCGPWVPTVCWREPKMRCLFNGVDRSDSRLSILKSTGQIKTFTRQLAIENITQAAARNMLCWGVAELERLGFPNCIHVHDEILIITPRNREAVLAAREAMLKVFGPHGNSPLGWATLVKPDEISITESMWEEETDIMLPFVNKEGKTIGNDRWGKIERNEPGCLNNLP